MLSSQLYKCNLSKMRSVIRFNMPIRRYLSNIKTYQQYNPLELSRLTAITSIDGRYGSNMTPLRHYFSEYGLIRHRTIVEIRWLQFMCNMTTIQDVPKLSNEAINALDKIILNFDNNDAKRVKYFEAITNHDVKAVEYMIKEKLTATSAELETLAEFVHFGCTSEDINNLAYSIIISDARNNFVIPLMNDVITDIQKIAHANSKVPMLARTHGQPATPTTLGKEMANFTWRLQRQREKFNKVEILGKFNGATGNYNALTIAYPDVNWENTIRQFIEDDLGLIHNPYTTQIESHDFISELIDTNARFNNILIDFCRDMWMYISIKYFSQRTVVDEVGSSTMPHKVNPIDFENAEGNLGIANSLFSHMSSKLLVSRYQRDLSDSTVMRNLGVGFAHSFISYYAIQRGISRVTPNPIRLAQDLDDNWEVLGEAIQTIMRRYGVKNSYEKLKYLTHGQYVNEKEILAFIRNLDCIPNNARARLLALRPETYLGRAEELARRV